MEMTSTRTVPASPQVVWDALNDPAVLKGCIPGCETLEPEGDRAFRIALVARIGPVSAKFNGRMQLADVDPPRGYTLSFDGQGGAAGFAKGSAKVSLAPVENTNQTALSYVVNAQVGGKIAQIGSRLVDGAAQKLADDFFGCFADTVATRVGVPEGTPAADPAPSLRGRRGWVRYAALAILGLMIAYLMTRVGRIR